MELKMINTGIFSINTWIIPLCRNLVLIADPAACSYTGDANAITDFLDREKLVPAGVILTHCHFDHVTGTGVLKSAYKNLKIAVHEKDGIFCGSRAAETQGSTLYDMGLDAFTEALKNLPDADVLLKGGETLDQVFGAEGDSELNESLKKWKVIYTPGHTAGGICLYSQNEKKLISGDTVFYQSYGRTDLPGGNEAEIVKSLGWLYRNLPEDTQVFPGHDTYGFELRENL